MKSPLRIIEYENFVSKNIFEDHKIGEQIYLMDEYQLSPVRDYEFVVPENVFIESFQAKDMSS